MRVAIVGFGLSGRFFHAPLIAATDGLEVATVVTADRERREQLARDYPHAEAVSTVDDLWSGSLPELVVVATPNSSHARVASAAIERGVPVVVDKPLAPTVTEAQALVAQAQTAGVTLSVFQNRRWDSDQLTLRRLIADGTLGAIIRYESRFERWRPQLEPGKWRENAPPEQGGGVLLDLGSHLADQALTLFGPATHVYAEVDARRGAPGDDDAFIALRHASGTLSHLHASAVTPSVGPRLRVQGTAAGFLAPHLDPQEAALRSGSRPDTVTVWGMPPEDQHVDVVSGDQSITVAAEPGDWPRFYVLLRDALSGAGPPPVDPRDAVEVLQLLEAARQSSRERSVIAV